HTHDQPKNDPAENLHHYLRGQALSPLVFGLPEGASCSPARLANSSSCLTCGSTRRGSAAQSMLNRGKFGSAARSASHARKFWRDAGDGYSTTRFASEVALRLTSFAQGILPRDGLP